MEIFYQMEETLNYIKSKIGNFVPETACILGSGLGELANEFENAIKISFSDIPSFKKPTIEGHAGYLVFVKINNKNVVFMQGRYHYYEGHTVQDVVFPIKVLKLLGLKNLIITNAAGGLNQNYKPGTLMIINDHINFTATNPLIGPNDEKMGPRFPDMSEVYNLELVKKANDIAKDLNIHVENGVYIGVTGPSYETPSEIRMFRNFGASAIGMSTVSEAIYANYCGLKVLGISCITNCAAGLSNTKLSHDEVVETANRVKSQFKTLVKNIIQKI